MDVRRVNINSLQPGFIQVAVCNLDVDDFCCRNILMHACMNIFVDTLIIPQILHVY